MKTLHTLGYAAWTPTTLKEKVEDLDALLADIRYSPSSRKDGFNRAELQDLLGRRYLHVPELGNKSYQEDEIDIADFDAGVMRLRHVAGEVGFRPETVILMCGCRDYRKCHRYAVARALAQPHGLDVEHLEPPADAQEGKVKAITLHEPWASLIAAAADLPEHEGKRHETRSWRTKHRGTLAIHAAKTKKSLSFLKESRPARDVLATLGYEKKSDLPFGKVVAVAELTDCVSTDDRGYVAEVAHQDQLFGNFAPGRYAWRLENIRRLPEPVAARGKQGLWDLDRAKLPQNIDD